MRRFCPNSRGAADRYLPTPNSPLTACAAREVGASETEICKSCPSQAARSTMTIWHGLRRSLGMRYTDIRVAFAEAIDYITAPTVVLPDDQPEAACGLLTESREAEAGAGAPSQS